MDFNYTAKERRAHILHKLESNPNVSVSQLSKEFLVSEVTIRKDLNELKRRNLLTRVRGGAIKHPDKGDMVDVEIDRKSLFHYKEKQAIGRLAASLINENETILIDSGSTTLEIAKNLDSFKNLTIITNAVNIAIELAKYKRFNIIMLGGFIRDSSLSTVGSIAESILKIFYCDKLFLGVDSISIDKGLSTTNIEEANINQTMMSISKQTIAVFDSSKFNKRNFAFIAPMDKIDTIVTDDNINREQRSQIKAMNIQLHTTNVHR
ncbi:DeoR/GlpR family DNA-binding transcription regulator [Dysgonomonas sp. BGC7]|uniref:DeoR/GlpR family DNA-binding transcription regulator n=1 Tax=Dysgonomonas sp. BGC7 TaxID=1658008 RepID=UPI0006835188|nr:DeoR/GlpR family DNA-binding transcription regulator [Dysgonomonas sp. BGC7]MBD8388570.1 DeoR/GlpR transcriptional regulator [Dysgonomonas sp. BGC7]